jgi:hypothetical protein
MLLLSLIMHCFRYLCYCFRYLCTVFAIWNNLEAHSFRCFAIVFWLTPLQNSANQRNQWASRIFQKQQWKQFCGLCQSLGHSRIGGKIPIALQRTLLAANYRPRAAGCWSDRQHPPPGGNEARVRVEDLSHSKRRLCRREGFILAKVKDCKFREWRLRVKGKDLKEWESFIEYRVTKYIKI